MAYSTNREEKQHEKGEIYSSGDCIVPGSCGNLSQRPYRDITSKDYMTDLIPVTAVIVAEHFFMVVTIILVLYYGAYHIREHKNGKILRVMLGYITFSKECKCGSICTDGTDRDLDALLQRADEKMYKNKQKMKRKRRTI